MEVVEVCGVRAKAFLVVGASFLVLAGCSIFVAPPTVQPTTHPLYSDSFNGQLQWRQSTTRQRTFAYVDGGYEISTSKAATWWFSPCPFTSENSFDHPYSVSVRAQVSTGVNGGEGAFGIVFDFVDSKNFKWLAVNRSGEFQLGSVAGGSARIIRDWTFDTAIRTGDSSNDLKLYQYADRMEVYVNGVLVTSDSSVSLPGQPFEIKLMAYNYDSTNQGTMKALFESVNISRIE